MKNVLKVLSEYAWLIFFLLAFFIGIFFIIWMGNSKIEVVPPPVPLIEIIKADLAQVDPIDNSTSPMVDEEEEITEVLEVSEVV